MDLHPRVPGNAIVRSFPEGGHRLTVAGDRECGPDTGSRSSLRLGGRRDVAAAREVEDAVVVDGEVHKLGVAFAVEASCEVSAAAVGLADDLDRSYRLTTYADIDVVDEKVTAGEHLVDVGPEDRNLRFADHVTRSAPPSGDGREPFARGAGIRVGHGRLPSYARASIDGTRRHSSLAVA